VSSWGYIALPLDDPYAPTILIACEFSGAFRDACNQVFGHHGHIALSCDHRECESSMGGLHYCGDVADVLWRRRWALVIGHPPCGPTALSNKAGKAQRIASGEHFEALALVVQIICAPADRVIVEQPLSDLAACYSAPTQQWSPHEFGVDQEKPWCIWSRNVGEVRPTAPTTARAAVQPHRVICYDATERERLRSRTDERMALAIAQQIDLSAAATEPQPLLALELERLASGYARRFGVVPAHYAEPLQRRAPPQAWAFAEASAMGQRKLEPDAGAQQRGAQPGEARSPVGRFSEHAAEAGEKPGTRPTSRTLPHTLCTPTPRAQRDI
jgi:hypothetical protein